MKTVGLATFFYDDNFGTCLQAYALQRVMEMFQYDVELIRYHRCTRANEGNRWKKIINMSPSMLWWRFINRKSILAKKARFTDFRKRYLHLANDENYYRDSDFHKLKGKYDAYVCGSDMIWSSEFKDDWIFYYLSFEEKRKTISYAPSYGKNCLTDEETTICKPLISNIGHLSCREIAGVNMIKEKFSLEANHVIDPTLLMDCKDWDAVISCQDKLINNEYSLVYLFNGTTKHGRDKVINQLANINDKELVILSGAEGKFKKYEYKNAAGPLEFVRLYRDCSFVVTDTFHGMLFAIIFNKPFIVLDKSPFGVTADRLTSTLESLNLKERYVTNDIILNDSILNMDYIKVNKTISSLREYSINYLKESLNEVCL